MSSRLGEALRRFWIYRLYIPLRQVAHGFRATSRAIRTRLGLREETGVEQTWQLPEVSWRSICRPYGARFLEIDKADGNVNLTELAVLNALCRTYRSRF